MSLHQLHAIRGLCQKLDAAQTRSCEHLFEHGGPHQDPGAKLLSLRLGGLEHCHNPCGLDAKLCRDELVAERTDKLRFAPRAEPLEQDRIEPTLVILRITAVTSLPFHPEFSVRPKSATASRMRLDRHAFQPWGYTFVRITSEVFYHYSVFSCS